ncbi:putative duf726 domain-containing protein [Golovinomyces cichoracearum]|uniref:Putative duf726 domain-containing protein n=1 Tax=Golovinomyces cichoracearum TaxID=62708 RepID=A0A420J219_9PEZI|nr:putative duf726 domain-containing protein [Golovinomyces cichoracearum]
MFQRYNGYLLRGLQRDGQISLSRLVSHCASTRGSTLADSKFQRRYHRGTHSNTKSRNSDNLIDLITLFEETELRDGAQQSPEDPIDKFLNQPTWSTNEILQDKDDSSETLITDQEIQRLLRLSALPTSVDRQQLESIRRDLQSQLKFVRHVQSVDTEGVEPLVCVRNETTEGIRDSTVTLDDLMPALSKEYQKGKCLRPRRREEPLPREENDWDVFATSENVVELNGEKYFAVQAQNQTPTLSEIMAEDE